MKKYIMDFFYMNDEDFKTFIILAIFFLVLLFICIILFSLAIHNIDKCMEETTHMVHDLEDMNAQKEYCKF